MAVKKRGRGDESWLWRDARQIAEVDAFFRGERSDGPLAIAPWRWPSMIGRPGAWAFLRASQATRSDALLRRNLAALDIAWPRTRFHTEPERFRVVETLEGMLPFAVPVDADGYSHHAVSHRGAKYVVIGYPTGDRVIDHRRGGMAVVVIEELRPGATLIRGFNERLAPPPTGKRPTRLVVKPPELARALRVSKDVAKRLLSGELLALRSGDVRLGVEWEVVVDACHAAWFAERSEVVAAFALAWKEGRALGKRLDALRSGKLAGLSPKQVRSRKIPTKAKLSQRARELAAAELGLPKKASAGRIAEEVQQVRFDHGMDAFRDLLLALRKRLGNEADAAFELVYQHVEHSH